MLVLCSSANVSSSVFFFFQAEDGIRDLTVTGVQTCALPISEKFRAWVNRIAFRLALNRQRGHRRRLVRDTAWHVAGTSDAVDGARSAEERVLVQRLRSEIESLPEKFRRVLQLSIVEEMGPADVGAVLGIPAGTVRSRLHTARKLLLEAMK